MGYTHYFYKKNHLTHPLAQWQNFVSDVKKVAQEFKLITTPNSLDFITDDKNIIRGNGNINILICDGGGEGIDPPSFDDKWIFFNGVDNDSYETFSIHRDSTEQLQERDWSKSEWEKNKRLFNCCKTQHRPYDLLVTATLALYKHHFKDDVELSSDGGYDGFIKGVELVNKILGYKIKVDELWEEEQEDD